MTLETLCGRRCAALALGILFVAVSIFAQQVPAPAQRGRGGRGGPATPPVVSPEVSPDRRITFRLFAPQAQSVRLTASDIPGAVQARIFTKNDSDVWSLTLDPVEPGAYRYNFNVDGVATIDPRSPSISESNTNVWSLVYVPGAGFMDTQDVPHGAVSAVNYFSTALQTWRRMHVYTPPGYESNNQKYPVLYLLHGAGDNDHSWSSVGRANFILDNLFAAKKARPMIVVMTAGHTPGPQQPGAGFLGAADGFARDFVADVMPLVEKRYRVFTDRDQTAIAGLSMGGSQTLNIAIPNLKRFAYIGVYSSGLMGESLATPASRGQAQPGPPAETSWERRNLTVLDNAALKKGLKLFWFSTGKDDFLLNITQATVSFFKKHGFNVVYEESPGGHTWINWRNYLHTFAPQLFR